MLNQALWDLGLTCLNSPPEVATLIAGLDAYAGEGERLEVGTRAGGSALLRMAYADPGDVLVTVDPYGNRPFHEGPGIYGDDLEAEALLNLAAAARGYRFRWQHWRLTSVDFLTHVAPLGYWRLGKQVAYRWRGAFLDGEHRPEAVTQEIALVAPRLVLHGHIVVDNTNHAQAWGVDYHQALTAAATRAGLGIAFQAFGADEVAVLTREPTY